MFTLKIRELEPMGTFAERLKRARLAAKLSQKEVADYAGITQTAYSHIETGKYGHSRKTAEIAKILGVDAHWLATGKGEPGLDDQIIRSLELLNESNKKLVLSTIRALLPTDSDKA